MANNREIISIHVGQAGCQLGSVCWELFGNEHKIDPDGKANEDDGILDTFYHQTQSGYKARAIFADLDPSVIDNIRSGSQKKCYYDQSLIEGNQSTDRNYAKAFCSNSSGDIMASLQNQIRYHAECTSNLQGFMTYFSLGGGTGSGLGSLLSEYLDSEFGTKLKWQYLITPDETDNEIENKMEVYNAVLATHASFERIDVGFLFDNKAVRNICREKLGISKPSYFNSNELISHVVASTTAAMRFESGLAVDMEEITKTLSPYPRVHFPIASYAPLRSRQYFGRMAPSMGVRQITAQCFDESYQCVEYSPNEGKYIACCQLYRGDIGHPPDLSETVQMVEASKDMKFVNWSPDGVQVGVSETMPAVLSAGAIARERTSGCNLSNTTAIMGMWSRLADTFETNLKEKQLVHLYTEQGLDDFSFSLAKEDLLSLVDDYRNLQSRSEGPFDEEDTFL